MHLFLFNNHSYTLKLLTILTSLLVLTLTSLINSATFPELSDIVFIFSAILLVPSANSVFESFICFTASATPVSYTHL